MEQLAHFVTKSFEYNNNRVLDVLNLATKSIICENVKSNDSTESFSNGDTDAEHDSDSIDIDITDVSSNGDDIKVHNENDNNNLNVIKRHCAMTPPPIKKSHKENSRHVTKNWLISDSPKKTFENGLCNTVGCNSFYTKI